MADSDYDRGDRRDDDDRPRRRRRDDDAPKKKSPVLMILLIVGGVLLLLCVVPCVGIMIWGNSLADGAKKAVEGVLTKAAAGDMSGAYNGMSADYKATHTQADFEKAIKDAKLDGFASATWTNSQSNSSSGSGEMTLSGTATLKSGGTTPVTAKLKMLPDFKTFEVDDIGGTSFSAGGTPKTTK